MPRSVAKSVRYVCFVLFSTTFSKFNLQPVKDFPATNNDVGKFLAAVVSMSAEFVVKYVCETNGKFRCASVGKLLLSTFE